MRTGKILNSLKEVSQNSMHYGNWKTLQEAAQILGISTAGVLYRIKKKKVQAGRFLGRIVVNIKQGD